MKRFYARLSSIARAISDNIGIIDRESLYLQLVKLLERSAKFNKALAASLITEIERRTPYWERVLTSDALRDYKESLKTLRDLSLK